MLTELRSVHPLDRRGVENARALEGAALKVRDEESRHVSARRREAAGGRNLQHVERQRPELLSGELVGDRTLALRIDRQREAARAHVERLENVLTHVVGKRTPRHFLDEQPGERNAMVRVAEDAARRDEGRRHRAGEVEAEWILLGRRSRRHAGEPLVEAGGVRQQVMQRDWSVPRRQLEPRQVSVHVAVEIEAALFHQLHHGGRGHHLRHRRDAEHGALRINRAPGLELCRAVATRAPPVSRRPPPTTPAPESADAPSRRARRRRQTSPRQRHPLAPMVPVLARPELRGCRRRGQVPGTSSEQEDVGTAPGVR